MAAIRRFDTVLAPTPPAAVAAAFGRSGIDVVRQRPPAPGGRRRYRDDLQALGLLVGMAGVLLVLAVTVGVAQAI